MTNLLSLNVVSAGEGVVLICFLSEANGGEDY